MKKRLTVILCAAMCALMCACGITPSVKSPGSQTSSTDIGTAESAVPSDTRDAFADGAQSTDEVPPEVSVDTVRLVMVGDILMHDPVIESGMTEDGCNYDHLFANISQELAYADIAMLNQEVIIAGEQFGISGYPRFNSPLELADAIGKAGFDVVLHATNHTLDKGRDAMLKCLSYWRQNHPDVKVAGMHDSEADADNVCVIEKNGIKVAVLNYTYGVNPAGDQYIKSEPYLVDILIESEVKRDIERAKEAADFIVVAPHWGEEYTHTPTSSQKKWCELFLKCGVDLVIGTHPHVLQPIEWLEGEDGQRTLVYWSLGNYVNSTSEQGRGIGARMLGAMADVVIGKDENGKVYIMSAGAIGLVTHVDFDSRGITTYKFEDDTQEMLAENEAVNKDPSFTYQYCIETFSELLGDFQD